MNERFYTIKSVSNEGVYRLIKGWGKRTIWKPLDFQHEGGGVPLLRLMSIYPKGEWFSSPRSAKSSLTKLLKVMDDYKTDTFTIIEVNGFGDIVSETPI